MPSLFRRSLPVVRVLGLVLVVAAGAAAQGIPARLSDADFWQLMTDCSEPNGYFRSENLLSNEIGFQAVIPELSATVRGGVYFGVGPEQNFTYIAAVHPGMAFIIDVRHQNAMQHLLYKALMEMSDDRADFLSRLFSRPRPANLDTTSTAAALFAAFDTVQPDSLMYYRTLDAVKARLTATHGFALDSNELRLIAHNFDVFYEAGPELSYNFTAGYSGYGRGMPTYASLMTATDGQSVARSYLATESNYRTVRDLELRNLIVPLTGDFAGPKAVRSAGEYVREHGGVVTVYYTSNVEQYLFQDGKWFDFEKNVATLPLDSTSTFIRAGHAGFRGSFSGGMSSSVLQPIEELLDGVKDGQIQTYSDVLQSSH